MHKRTQAAGKKENHMECSCGNRTFPANCIRIKKKLQLHSLFKWVVHRVGGKCRVGGAKAAPLSPSAGKTGEKSFFS